MSPLDATAEQLGRTLRRLRKERHLDLRDLAARVGLDPAELTRLERGTHRVGLDTLVRLLSALSAGPKDLGVGGGAATGGAGGEDDPLRSSVAASRAPDGRSGGATGGSEPIWHPLSLL